MISTLIFLDHRQIIRTCFSIKQSIVIDLMISYRSFGKPGLIQKFKSGSMDFNHELRTLILGCLVNLDVLDSFIGLLLTYKVYGEL